MAYSLQSCSKNNVSSNLSFEFEDVEKKYAFKEAKHSVLFKSIKQQKLIIA
jgi:hypothetical protein